MGENNTREDYLDELLSSVSKDKTQEELELMSLRSQLKKMREADEQTLNNSSYSEDDFLREFEKELNEEDYKDFLSEFEAELDEDGSIPELEEVAASHSAEETQKAPSGEEAAAGISEPDLFAFDEIIDEINEETKDTVTGEEVLKESETQGLISEESDLSKTEDGELDLSGNKDANLMDILSESEELKDIGEMLSGEGELSEVDEIGNFAELEMQQEASADISPEIVSRKDKGKGKKKEGFFAKLARILFGEEEEEEEVLIAAASAGDGNEAIPLTEENRKILEELEVSEAKKKEKKKKEKKPKVKKAKEKKEKKPKVKKPKKEKPVDNTPPLPKVPVILIFIMALSMMALVLLGTNLGAYTAQVKQARELFRSGDYAEGLASLNGSDIKEKDQQIYNQLVVLAAVESEYNNYTVFIANDKIDMALDSLICAAGRYKLNQENAGRWECTEELDQLKTQIEKALSEQFGMSFDEAVSIYESDDRQEYSRAILQKKQELGLE